MHNELEKLFINTKPLEEMIKKATIIVDTNVLLSAYQTKPVTFEAILNILNELANKKRLKIPSHVIREFNENRPKRIKDITNELQQFINTVDSIKNTQPPKKLDKILPAINVLEDNHAEKVVELQQEFNNQLNTLKESGIAFKEELNTLVLKLSEYMDHDPILLKYEEIIRKSYFEPGISLSEKDLEDEGKKRVEREIPPGFRDKAKKANRYGDLIIWLQICELKEDVIFITFDNKEDWVYKDSKGNVLGARVELVQEFYEKSDGKTLKILHPGKFVELYTDGNVDSEVKVDLKEIEKIKKSIKEIFRNNVDEKERLIQSIEKTSGKCEEMLAVFEQKMYDRSFEEFEVDYYALSYGIGDHPENLSIVELKKLDKEFRELYISMYRELLEIEYQTV
ncbi:TPA: PIN-like domain-containing protein [Bacillus cereus]